MRISLKKLCYISLALFMFLFILLFISYTQHNINHIESKIVAAVDCILEGEGDCELDLSILFTEFDWDTVSIFVGGNPAQIQSHLQFYPDISDGIIFSLDGQPVMVSTSTYNFPDDIQPQIGYYVEREKVNDPFFVSIPIEEAKIQVEKFLSSDGCYRYLVYYKQASPQ